MHRVELYLHLNGLVERRRVEPLQIVEEHRERVFRPREYIDDELAITNCQLRNVDKRPSPAFVKAYGHNGYFTSLKQIVHFYNTRDVRCRVASPMMPAKARRAGPHRSRPTT